MCRKYGVGRAERDQQTAPRRTVGAAIALLCARADQTSEPSEHSAAAERIAVTRPSVVLGKRVATTRCGVVVLPCVSWLRFAGDHALLLRRRFGHGGALIDRLGLRRCGEHRFR